MSSVSAALSCYLCLCDAAMAAGLLVIVTSALAATKSTAAIEAIFAKPKIAVACLSSLAIPPPHLPKVCMNDCA